MKKDATKGLFYSLLSYVLMFFILQLYTIWIQEPENLVVLIFTVPLFVLNIFVIVLSLRYGAKSKYNNNVLGEWLYNSRFFLKLIFYFGMYYVLTNFNIKIEIFIVITILFSLVDLLIHFAYKKFGFNNEVLTVEQKNEMLEKEVLKMTKMIPLYIGIFIVLLIIFNQVLR